MDAGTDAGGMDAGTDAGGMDAGTDAGGMDAGSDAGSGDAGPPCIPDFTLAWSPTSLARGKGVAFGDLDGDGRDELAVGFSAGGAFEVLRWETSAFTTVYTGTEPHGETVGLLWADLDLSGDLDLISSDAPGNRIRVFDNVSGALSISFTSTESRDFQEASAADMDMDGDLDIATVTSANGGDIIYRNAAGVFTAMMELHAAIKTPGSEGSTDVRFGQLGGDARPDLAFTFQSNSGRPLLRVYEGNPTGFTEMFTAPEVGLATALDIADYDGNGTTDIAVAYFGAVGGWPAQVRVYRNDGGFVFTSVFQDTGCSAHDVAWGDIEGDGDMDLAALCHDAPLRVYINDGAGGLSLHWSSTAVFRYADLAWGDYNDDGVLDLAATRDSGNPPTAPGVEVYAGSCTVP